MKHDQRTRGRFLGGTVPFGYRISADGALEPELAEQEAIARMQSLKVEGKSLRAIAAMITAESLPITHTAAKKILDRTEASPRPARLARRRKQIDRDGEPTPPIAP